MKSQQQRLRTVELSLTPSEVVPLWMKNSLADKYECSLFQSPPPRQAIADSIARIVRDGLKGEPDAVIERAIHQALREGLCLFMIFVDANDHVQWQFYERQREYGFLCGCLMSTMDCLVSSVSEELLRTITLAFVNPVLLLEGALSRVSAERFWGHPILCSDSAAKLKKQLELVDDVLEIFNAIARVARFRQLNKGEIRDRLNSDIDQQVQRMMLLSRGQMLAVLGEEREWRANFDQLTATYKTIDKAREVQK